MTARQAHRRQPRMPVRRAIGRGLLRLAGWRVVGEPPETGMILGAPHTSNWDYVLMLLVMWALAAPPRVLVKREVFRGPLGWLLRATGAIPVDRANPVGVVRQLITEARSSEQFRLIVAAEGTRKRAEYWKSGFYRIARAASLPIALGFIDGRTRTAGFGPTIRATGDLAADMDTIRAFYADKYGIHPELRTEPRLREEQGRAAS